MSSKNSGSGTLIRRLPEPESYQSESNIFVSLISKWQSYIISKRGRISNCRFRNDSHISFRIENSFVFSAYVIGEKILKFKKSSFLPPSYQNECHISYQNEEHSGSNSVLSSACLPFSRRNGICQQYEVP